MILLAIDTSGKTAGCAVMQDDLLLGSRMVYTARAHSQILLPMVRALLADTGHTVQDVDVFAAANGPGSYTGLRIGVAAVQALAFAGEKQCAGISTLEGLAWNLCGRTGVLCACLKARLDLCYCAFFAADGKTVTRLTEDAVLPAAEIAAQMKQYEQPVMVIGDGTETMQTVTTDFLTAPPHLLHQSACGIALAALHTGTVSPEQLSVRYLQAVKIG